jgi:hypothetical protein
MSATSSGKSIRVLSASADPALRYSRELLLRSQGCEVSTSLSKGHAKALIQAQQFDLLIFGNSLTADACQELARVFRVFNPEGKIIEILSAQWDLPMNQPDATAVGPEELIERVLKFSCDRN